MNCKFIKSDGSACNARALKNNPYCYRHSMAAAKKDEQNRMDPVRRLVINLPDLNIENPHDLPPFLIDTIRNVRSHVLDSKTGSVIGYLTSILLRSYEVSDLQSRIEKVEQLISSGFVEIKDTV